LTTFNHAPCPSSTSIDPQCVFSTNDRDEPVFRDKDGATTIQASGASYDTEKHQLISEPTYIVVYQYNVPVLSPGKIDALREQYRKLRRQQLVMRVDRRVTTSF
jgi:hypothetical protein